MLNFIVKKKSYKRTQLKLYYLTLSFSIFILYLFKKEIELIYIN